MLSKRMALGLLFVCCAGSPARPADNNDLQLWRTQALDLVNQSRMEHGLPPLERGSALDEAAQLHARDMLERHYYSHTSPEGDTVQDRYVDAGGSRWRLIEENIAHCEGCRPPISPETVGRLQRGWMDSPHHRENMLREGIDRFGYGIVLDSSRGLYAVQTFAGPGTPRGTGEDETIETLSKRELQTQAAQLINRAREKVGVKSLSLDPGLSQVAETALPPPNSEDISAQSQSNLFNELPAEERGRWKSLSLIIGACGGCGTEPTDADLRYFRRQWLDSPQYHEQILDPNLTGIGFALQANGLGRKVAVVVLGTGR
jgi:uncharacterized protein YkwD